VRDHHADKGPQDALSVWLLAAAVGDVSVSDLMRLLMLQTLFTQRSRAERGLDCTQL
jgi:hypothetical protein